MDDTGYDYIIVGGGTAGCVLANRLSEDAELSVLLIEHGGPGRHPVLHTPSGFIAAMRSRPHTYRYRTRPTVPGGQEEVWLRGKVLGGSSSINGMVYLRGEADDYDSLGRTVGATWSWSSMRSAFRSIEDHQLGASADRGAGGPLAVRIPAQDDEIVRAVIDAAGTLGIQTVPDVNAATGERIGFTPTTIRAGRRVSAATAFLRPALRRPNLTVLDRTQVGYLLFDGTRVVGVRARDRRGTRDHHARLEVLLAAGTIETPLLLERSGIGDPQVLAGAGVDVRVPSPNVGRRVLEHRGVAVTVLVIDRRRRSGWVDALVVPHPMRATGLVRRGEKDDRAAYELAAWVRAGGDGRPDAQLMITRRPDGESHGRAGGDELRIKGYALRAGTTSELHITGTQPHDPPRIEPRYLGTPADRRTAVGVLGRIRQLLSAEPLAAVLGDERSPGRDVASDEQVLRYAARTGGGFYHAVGSCAMGPADEDVVDPLLRVRGVSGLRVVDAAVLPGLPSGGTAAPVMAVAWRAADLLLES